MVQQNIKMFDKNIIVNTNVYNAHDTSLVFPGKVTAFGEYLNQNFGSLLESFHSYKISPREPSAGQLWFRDVNVHIQIFDKNWKALAAIHTQEESNLPADNISAINDLHIKDGYLWVYTRLIPEQNIILDPTGEWQPVYLNEFNFDNIGYVINKIRNDAVPSCPSHFTTEFILNDVNLAIISKDILKREDKYLGWVAELKEYATVSNSELLYRGFPKIFGGINIHKNYSIYGKGIATKIIDAVTDFAILNTETINENYLPKLDEDKLVLREQIDPEILPQGTNHTNAINALVKARVLSYAGVKPSQLPLLDDDGNLLTQIIPGYNTLIKLINENIADGQILSLDILKESTKFRPPVGTKKVFGILLAANTDTYTEQYQEEESYTYHYTISENYYVDEEYNVPVKHDVSVSANNLSNCPVYFGVNERSPSGLTYDDLSNKFFMIGKQNTALYTLDQNNVVATKIDSNKNFGIGETKPNSLAFDSNNGILYMVGETLNALLKINNDGTGNATRVGNNAVNFGDNISNARLFYNTKSKKLQLLGMNNNTFKAYDVDATSGTAMVDTVLSAVMSSNQITAPQAATFGDNTLYIIDGNDLYKFLYDDSFNITASSVTLKTPSTPSRLRKETNFTGLAFNNGILYGVGSRNKMFYQINVQSGNAVPLCVNSAGRLPPPAPPAPPPARKRREGNYTSPGDRVGGNNGNGNGAK